MVILYKNIFHVFYFIELKYVTSVSISQMNITKEMKTVSRVGTEFSTKESRVGTEFSTKESRVGTEFSTKEEI